MHTVAPAGNRADGSAAHSSAPGNLSLREVALVEKALNKQDGFCRDHFDTPELRSCQSVVTEPANPSGPGDSRVGFLRRPVSSFRV